MKTILIVEDDSNVRQELSILLSNEGYRVKEITDFRDVETQLEKADAVAGEEVKVIVSNPCFEIWYLCHFLASTKQYASSNEVLKALQQYIPEYSKSMKGLWDRIGGRTEIAIANAIILEDKCLEQSLKPHTTAFMPSTEVYRILKLLFPKEKHTPALMESIVAENEEAFKELAK